MQTSAPKPQSFASANTSSRDQRTLWRALAITGLVLSILVHGYQSLLNWDDRQARTFWLLPFLLLAWWLVMQLLMGHAWRRIRREPDLLIPLGVVLGAITILELLAELPGLGSLLSAGWSMHILGMLQRLSLWLLIHVGLWTAYAAWQTRLLLQKPAVWSPTPDLSPWTNIVPVFWRTFFVLALGLVVLYVGLAVNIALAGLTGIFVVMFLLGVLSLAWNFATAALLPVALHEEGDFPRALRSGFSASWRHKRLWWRELLAQLLLLGLIVGYVINYQGTKQHISVNAFWVGGYFEDCKWHTKYLDVLQMAPIPLVELLLSALFLVLAIAVKLTIIERLQLVQMPKWEGKALPAKPLA